MGDATEIEFTVGERPHLPSRPADVKVNGTGWGEVDSIDTDPVTVTVAERNRLTEDSQVLGWTDATVTPQSGQTWKVELLDPADRSVIATVDSLTGTSTTIAHSVFAGHQGRSCGWRRSATASRACRAMRSRCWSRASRQTPASTPPTPIC